MDSSIVTALITGGLSLIGVVFSNMMNSRKMEQKLEVNSAVTNTRLDNLITTVERHNNFAARMPVVEEQIKVINHRLDDLERKEVK